MAPVTASAPSDGIRVLVVDDDAQVRNSLARVLRAQGYLAEEATGTDEALDLCYREGPPPVVVSDIHMPGRDGIALLAELRARHPDTAVLMLTGDADVALAVACLKTGAMDYLAKPVLVDEVRARVAKALEERRQRIELRELRESYQAELEGRVLALSRRNKEMFLAQVHMAVRMLEAKDEYTRGHSGRVSEYAVLTGRQLGLDRLMLDELRLGGELHDIGKIGTRDAILNKPGRLTDEEFAEMRRHTTDGEEMLSVLRADHPEVLHIVRWHHERMDGSGFPDGLMGAQIPLSARIIGVVDAFDAMTSTRAYRPEQSLDYAFGELERGKGRQFDPEIVNAFVAAFPNRSPATHHA
jgi:putative two-component system response regulator